MKLYANFFFILFYQGLNCSPEGTAQFFRFVVDFLDSGPSYSPAWNIYDSKKVYVVIVV